jgi:magnesium chelatase subunit D
VKSASHIHTGDIALDATLRAAAPHQKRRKNESELALSLRQEDVREKIREKCIGNFLLFLVDASGSMGARGRMAASKGAIMSLLLDAYQKRDRVAMVSFRRNKAFLNLPPTSSVEMAARLLKEMPVGGRTPLSAGLVKGFEILRSYLIKDPASRPIVIIITDGKANVALGSQKPVEETLTLASKMRLDKRIRYMVVDTEDTGLVSFGLAKQLAAAMGAQYSKIEDLRADQLLNIVKGNSL